MIHRDTLIMQGYGKAIVCAVGDYGKFEQSKKKIVAKKDKKDDKKAADLKSQNTPIEE